jgi:mannose-6-phosphate isomerase-like protein (cupin superfamily)
MTSSDWGRVRPADIPWKQFDDPHGRPTTPVRVLKEGDPGVLEVRFPPGYVAGLHWHPYDTLYIVTRGSMEIGDEGVYRPGDIRWVRAGHVYGPEAAGAEGVDFFLVSLGGEIELNWADLVDVPERLRERLETSGEPWGRVNLQEAPWQDFEDPAGRPTQPVQVLLDDDPYVLRTRFSPDYVAGDHWHDFDTLYFITSGSMRFGDEGWYEPGEVRWVRGGHSYGPEEPGEGGVEFILVSCGGPVNLHWSDLEPPPSKP